MGLQSDTMSLHSNTWAYIVIHGDRWGYIDGDRWGYIDGDRWGYIDGDRW